MLLDSKGGCLEVREISLDVSVCAAYLFLYAIFR